MNNRIKLSLGVSALALLFSVSLSAQQSQTPNTQAPPAAPPQTQPAGPPNSDQPAPPPTDQTTAPSSQSSPAGQGQSNQAPDQATPPAGGSATTGGANSAAQAGGVQTFSGTVVKQGDKYMLQDESSGQTYDVDHQDEVQKYVGKRVRVHGTLDPSGKMIHLQ